MEKIDAETKALLIKLANGYEYEERIITADKDGKVERVRIIKKYVPPNLKAMEKIEFLKAFGYWE